VSSFYPHERVFEMGAVEHFSERLRGSEWGEPTDRDTSGLDVRVLDFEGFLHVEMTPVGVADGTPRTIALFSLSEARQFDSAIGAVIERVEGLGEM